MNGLGQTRLKFLTNVALGALSTLTIAGISANPSFGSPEGVSEGMQYNLIQAVILGMVQGLTEFLPISSTAHLKAIPVALGWGDPGVALTAVIQLGSIVAVLIYFWQDLTDITLGTWRAIKTSNYQANEFRLAVGIAVGTIPILFFGLLITVFVPDYDHSILRSTTAIAVASILMGLLLGVAEKICTHKRSYEQIGIKDGIIVGLAQTLAIIPGVSRSGSTITAGLFISLQRATAARFSFLLGIPAITLAGIVGLKDVIDVGINGNELASVIVAVVSSAIFSYLAIAWLIRYLQQQSTWVFVWYRVILGLVILGAIAFQ
ncbi:MAG: undecaprenyl-diphosphate phosphatase [Chroococcales cyanobacterium]